MARPGVAPPLGVVERWTDLEVLHEHGDDDIDEDELCNEDEHDEVDGSDKRIHATVGDAVVRVVAVVTQCVLIEQQQQHC